MADGPSYLPANKLEWVVWLSLVFAGAFVGRFFVVTAYRYAKTRGT